MSHDLPSWSEAAPRLLPVLRRPERLPNAWAAPGDGPALILRPFTPLIAELPVLDSDTTRTFVTRAHLQAWGMSGAQVLTAAQGNLDPVDGLTRETHAWRLAAGDGYDSSRLALPGWLRAFQTRFEQPVAAVPTARDLLVGSASDAEELLELTLRAFSSGADPISPLLYTYDGARIVPWRPPELTDRLDAAILRLRVDDYRHQTIGLAGWVPRTTRILPFQLAEIGGRRCTITRWKGEPEVLLPSVDVVMVEDRAIPWAALQRILPLEDWGLRPARWHARWPDPVLQRELARNSLGVEE